MVGWSLSGFGGYEARNSLGQGALLGVGVPGRHAPHLAVLVLDVDDAEVGHDRDRHLGQAFDHLSEVDDLGEDLRRQQQELVAAPALEELLDEMLALGRQGGGMEELAQVPADRVHELDDRGVAVARVATEHLDDADACAAVADGKGVGTAQPVPPQCISDEAAIDCEVGHPQPVAVLHDPLRQALAPAGGIDVLLAGEGGRNGRRAGPDVAAHQLVMG